MSYSRCLAIAMVAAVAMTALVVPAAAQTDAAPAPFYAGPLGLTPSIQLTNVGWDSNPYNQSKAFDPPSDFTSAVSPSLDVSIRSPRFNLTAQSRWDYYYFRRLSSLRALDIDQSGRIEATLNRLSPYVSGSWTTTRHRQNLEIDAMVKRENHNVEGGTYVRLSGKTFIGVYGGHSAVDYEGGALFRATELAPALNHTTVHGGLQLRYQATPLTSFAVGVTRSRNRFASSPDRDADGWEIGPSVEFKPLALISGRASVGFQKVTFRSGAQPEFKSTVAAVDLNYTFRGRTQFGVGVERRLEYSYLETQLDYVLSGLTTSMAHRLNERWELGGNVGRYALSYRRRETQGIQATPTQTYINYGGNVGFRFGRHRAGLNIDFYDRDADIAAFEYNRLRVTSSLTYVF